MAVATASHTQRISANRLLRTFSATRASGFAGRWSASSFPEEVAETGRALHCEAGVVAMDLPSQTETPESFLRRTSEAWEFVIEEEAEPIFRLFRNADLSTVATNERSMTESSHDEIFALYDEYRPRLFGYLRSLRLKREEAEEVIQEAFLQLATTLVENKAIENLQGWIIRVAHHLAVDVIKCKEREAERTRDVSIFAFEHVRDLRSSPEETLLEQEQRRQMEDALSRFGPLQRQCFHMRAQGFRYKDIGLALGISTQRVALVVKQVTVRLAAICG